MAHNSYAATVLGKALDIAKVGGSATCGDISSAMFVKTRVEHKRLLNTLSNLTKSGRLRRVSQGVYATPDAAAKAAVKPEKREVMWRLLRINKRVTLDYLMEMAEVGRDYARQWLAMLEKHGIVRRMDKPDGGTWGQAWLLLHDSIDMPVLDDDAARLRRLRLKKKGIIAAQLDVIDAAVAETRQILATLEEEE